MKERVKKEIIRLHQFFQDWFSGKVERSRELFDLNVSSHFDSSFEFVIPDGTHMTKTQTVASLRSAYGYDPKFKIKVRFKSFRKIEKNTYLVVYEERQVDEGKKNRRLSVAVVRHSNKAGGLKWLHCHEAPIK